MNWLRTSPAKRFIHNWKKLTGNTNNLIIFSGDQKLEHLNDDFYGPGIDPEDNDPRHMFAIAQQWLSGNKPGAFATHLGLIEQYGPHYPDVNYIVKVNGKTNLVPTEHKDPHSKQLWSIKQIKKFMDHFSQLNICGVGYTVYLGSKHEHEMLAEAAKVIFEAHCHGLVAILWVYPRGKAIQNERAGNLIAGCAGVAATLGADVVKINPPEDVATWLPLAVQAAGATKVVISGGPKITDEQLLANVKNYINLGAAGIAIGRNVHQRSLVDGTALLDTISEQLYK